MRNSAFVIVLHRLRVPFLVLILSYTVAMVGLLIIDAVDANGNPYQMSIFDAFYFVTYTATTIGFGETPYTFTYSQRIWVTFVIYIVVLGWFYSIGTIIGLIQNKQLLIELARGKFKRQVKEIKQKYIIVLGYNYITSEIIKKAIQNQIRVVVIEKDESRANNLRMESFTPIVPVLVDDAFKARTLEFAGIKSHYAKAIITLFTDDTLNLRVAITSKLLNKNIMIASRTTSKSHREHLNALGVEVTKDPFEINASHIKMAIKYPNLLRLERWTQKLGELSLPITSFPDGKYIVCGYGSLGKYIHDVLSSINIDVTFIEVNPQKSDNLSLIIGKGDNSEVLLSAGIATATTIIIGTNNDTENLSILALAKKLNPYIITVVRENEVDDFSIFSNADIDYLLMPSRTLIHQVANAIINPLTDRFNRYVYTQNEEWGAKLVKRLIMQINDNPLFFRLQTDKKNSPQIYQALKNNDKLKLSILKTSLRDKTQSNKMVPLLVFTHNKQEILLPEWEYEIESGDEVLFALDENALDDLEYIAQNMYEFEYVRS